MKRLKKVIEDINLKNVSVSTWVRTVQMLLSIALIIFKCFGIIIPEISEDVIYNIVVAVFTTITFLQVFWKNNSFTDAAQVADVFVHMAHDDRFHKEDVNYEVDSMEVQKKN